MRYIDRQREKEQRILNFWYTCFSYHSLSSFFYNCSAVKFTVFQCFHALFKHN